MIAERAFNQWVLVCDKIERRVDRYERKARFKKMYRRSNGGRGGGGSNGQSSSVKWGGVNIGTESGARDSDGGVGRTKRDSKKRWGAEEAEEDVRKGSASATAAVAATEAGRQDDAQKVVDAWRGQSQQNGQLDGTAIGTVRDGQSAVLSQVFAEPEEENEHGSLSTTTLPLTPQNIFESGLAGGSHPATPSSLLSSAVQLNGTGRTNPSLPTTSETPGEMVPPSLPTILSSGPTASTSTMPSILTHNYNSSRPPHPPPSSSSSYAHHQIRLDYSNTTNPHALSSTRRPYSAENRLSSGRPNHNRGLSVGSVPLGGFFSSSTGGGLRRNNSTSSSRRGVVRVERPLSSSSSAIGPAGTSFFGRRSPGSVVGRFSRDPLLSSSSSEESEGSESDDGRRRGPAARGGSGRRRSGRGGLSSSDGGGGNSTKEESDSESGGEGRGVRHRRHHGSQYARQRGTRRQMYDSQDADPLAGNVEYVERAHHRRQSVPLLRSSTEHISTGNSSAAGADIGSESAGLSAGTTSGAGLLGRSLGRVVASGWEAMTRGRGGSRSHEQLGAAEVGTRSPARDGEVDETAPLLQPSS
ncbi:hypothetical protein HK102_013662 [Quaeritorhiza haematococci]|nr:hypothetical protein HK102_013662 [Quaeritorhiza haematococci]